MGKIPWRREWLLAPVFLPGASHGQRILAGYSPWGRTEPDRTEVTDAGLFLPLREAAAVAAAVEAAVEAAMEAAAVTVEAAVEAAMEAAAVTVEAAMEAAAVTVEAAMEAAVAAPGPAGYVRLIYCRQRWGPWWSLLRTVTPRSS